MSQIKTEQQYKAMMARIDEIFFTTDENTLADDPRLLELDILSSLVEKYEKEHFRWSDKCAVEQVKFFF